MPLWEHQQEALPQQWVLWALSWWQVLLLPVVVGQELARQQGRQDQTPWVRIVPADNLRWQELWCWLLQAVV